MPDLTPETFLYCSSVEKFVTIKGSKDYLVRHGLSVFGDYVYDWHCQCESFKYRKKCKHIEEAKKEYCGWDQFVDGGEPEGGVCPKCSQPLLSRQVAV
jgi:hypothetical protein